MASADILDNLEKTVKKLENIADEVEHLGKEFFQKVPIERNVEHHKTDRVFSPPPEPSVSYRWGVLGDELTSLQREAFRKYQRYYTSAYQLVKEYLPEKEAEFVNCYEDKESLF